MPATGIGYRAPLYLKLRAENWRDVEMADWGGVICVMSGKRLTTGLYDKGDNRSGCVSFMAISHADALNPLFSSRASTPEACASKTALIVVSD